jgi:hypothetical protein
MVTALDDAPGPVPNEPKTLELVSVTLGAPEKIKWFVDPKTELEILVVVVNGTSR